MTYDNFIQYVKHPDTLSTEAQPLLKELIIQYPYFSIARWLYLKSLHISKSIYFESELKKTALYAANRRNLYYFIHPEDTAVNETSGRQRSASSGSYFDMINLLDNKNENNIGSLQSLAERLKEAREMLVSEENNISHSPQNETTPLPAAQTSDSFSAENATDVEFDIQVALAKKLIKNKKYEEAIPILEKLNLINPKKSIYFADQIRFLKKITQK